MVKFSFWSGWWPSGAFFDRRRSSEYHFLGVRYRQLIRIAVDRCYSVARLIRGTVNVRRHEAIRAMRMEGCRGAPWSEELDGKELHGGAGGDLEPREPAVSCTSST